MNDASFERWENRLAATARTFAYPPTPDIASGVKAQVTGKESRLKRGLRRAPISRRLVWAVFVALILLGGLLAVPQVRAALVEFLQIGAVRIFLVEPTPTPIPPSATATPGTPSPSPTPISSLLDLAGETTLAEAQTQVDFPIRLPTYPAELGEPDYVFRQDFGEPVVILVWVEPDQPDQARLSLHQLGPGVYAEKGDPGSVQETTVNGRRAVWTTGVYVLQFRSGNRVESDLRRLVKGHVLIWVEDKITYRLETDLSLEEAVRVAESLR